MTEVHPINPNTAVAVADARETPRPDWCFRTFAATVLFSTFFLPFFVGPMVRKQSLRRYDRSHIPTIPNLKIDSLIATNFTLSFHPNQISADWNLKMNLETDNRHGYLSFSNMTVSIFHDVLQAGVTDVIPFDVVPLNSTTHFDVKFSGSSVLITDSIINDISGRIAAQGTLTVHVTIETSVKKSYKGRWTDELQLKMDCLDISLYFGYLDYKSRAQMLNPPNVCKDVW
ncbi:hypothetical protein POM88_047237 [Heracleum sosnowskyi]|uniref:Late embryogenesis abundant protein LEA-2 subgroup domain-containing protein n=1 Tax=Heracleum sosnowskyi TaxID=360622 RepID=A0AAD8GTX0_9APIA|nr:hypothetical protein POM88_047237 [Heracleum sosnowskyi]